VIGGPRPARGLRLLRGLCHRSEPGDQKTRQKREGNAASSAVEVFQELHRSSFPGLAQPRRTAHRQMDRDNLATTVRTTCAYCKRLLLFPKEDRGAKWFSSHYLKGTKRKNGERVERVSSLPSLLPLGGLR